jgi:hypothetical protein
LRRSFIIRALERGVDPRVVASWHPPLLGVDCSTAWANCSEVPDLSTADSPPADGGASRCRTGHSAPSIWPAIFGTSMKPHPRQKCRHTWKTSPYSFQHRDCSLSPVPVSGFQRP